MNYIRKENYNDTLSLEEINEKYDFYVKKGEPTRYSKKFQLYKANSNVRLEEYKNLNQTQDAS